MGGYDLCVNLIYGLIWFMCISKLSMRSEFWVGGQTDRHTDRQTHQYHDSAWPIGQTKWKSWSEKEEEKKKKIYV